MFPNRAESHTGNVDFCHAVSRIVARRSADIFSLQTRKTCVWEYEGNLCLLLSQSLYIHRAYGELTLEPARELETGSLFEV